MQMLEKYCLLQIDFSSARKSKTLSYVLRVKNRNYFFAYWTRKEAYLKAVGKGIDEDLLKFNNSSIPDMTSAMIPFSVIDKGVGHWSLIDFSPQAGYAAALVSEGRNLKVKFLEDLL
jgi:4'-phosphopantetheinyl transferase